MNTVFDPKTKKNQHFVPVFWQRRFAGDDGKLYVLENNGISVGNAKKLMCSDWLYTTFDIDWNPSNHLEEDASTFETKAAAAFRALDIAGSAGSFEDQVLLRRFIAFSACRHPDTMLSGHRRSKQLAYLLADAHSHTLEDFCHIALERFYINHNDAIDIYNYLKGVSKAQLLEEANEVQLMTPCDPNLPQQISIDEETIDIIIKLLSHHDVTVFDAPSGSSFIMGDTPFSPDLGRGFIIPMSSHIALSWQPDATNEFPGWTRRAATTEELDDSNQLQFDNALKIVIGPSEDTLEKYKS